MSTQFEYKGRKIEVRVIPCKPLYPLLYWVKGEFKGSGSYSYSSKAAAKKHAKELIDAEEAAQ
jgi:hypothetical protein